jgi:hypothetical protein
MSITTLEIDGTTYRLKDTIGADVFVGWTEHAGVGDGQISRTIYSGIPYLIEHVCVDDKGRAIRAADVPPWHIPELRQPLVDRLHLDKFNDAMDKLITADTDDEPADGKEKNLPNG